VIYEEDTALYTQLHAGEFDVDEDLACAMYEELVSAAEEAGFRQYEVANFARSGAAAIGAAIPGLACHHNVNYWRAGAFHGLGPGATGYVRGARTRNWANTTLYCEQLELGRRAVESSEHLSPLARAGEAAAFGFRMNAGWPYADFLRATGFDLRIHWAEDIAWLVQQGLAEADGDALQPTPRGLRFADLAAERLLRPEPQPDGKPGPAGALDPNAI
jgi:oxygen-independent coproporphyrinogen-3 oxidase